MADHSEQLDALYPFLSGRAKDAGAESAALRDSVRDAIHRVREVQVACDHFLWDLAHTLLADHRGSSGAAS